MTRNRWFVGVAVALAMAVSACTGSPESGEDQAGSPSPTSVTVTVTETVTAEATPTETPSPDDQQTPPGPSEAPTTEVTSKAPVEPEVQFEHSGQSRRAKLEVPTLRLPRGVSAVIDVTGFRTYHLEVPTSLYGKHIRCKTRGADNDNDRLNFQVSTQSDLLDDNYLDEDEYFIDDDGLLFTTQTWSEGHFRRVYSTVYTSADDERRYIDEDQNGMTIDNPKFKYAFSGDFKEFRLSMVGVSLDSISIDPGEVTVNAVIRCR